MTKINYFESLGKKVEDLWNFPFRSFNEFQEAVKNKIVVDIGVPMDMARKWITESPTAPKEWRILTYTFMFILFLAPFSYIPIGIFTHNLWLIALLPVSLLVVFVGSPIARKMIPLHWLIIGGFGLYALFTGSIPSVYSWLPLLIQYILEEQLYKGSAQIAREHILKNEEVLCLFWKHLDIGVYMSNGDNYSQRYATISNNTVQHENIDEEWKEYLEKRNKA